ncbi:MAG TPA: SDR family oxidoreductase [Enhygromyxa sp.]|nr:SDR family oxidoreductase [Enhygromyxa sp.]
MSERPTIIVTGGSAGIGLAIVERFADLDYRVLSLARRRCPVDTVESILVDLGSPEAVAAGLARVRDRLPRSGQIHLIHNAANMPTDSAIDFDSRVLERTFRLNVTTPAELDAGLIPHMSRGSSIVFIASTLSEKGVPGRLSYVTSKHAMLGLMRATVQDLFGSGIHCLCVAPGFTDTEMLQQGLSTPGFAQAVRDMVSFGRLLEPEEVADIVVFATRTPALNGAIVHANLGQRER